MNGRRLFLTIRPTPVIFRRAAEATARPLPNAEKDAARRRILAVARRCGDGRDELSPAEQHVVDAVEEYLGRTGQAATSPSQANAAGASASSRAAECGVHGQDAQHRPVQAAGKLKARNRAGRCERPSAHHQGTQGGCRVGHCRNRADQGGLYSRVGERRECVRARDSDREAQGGSR